MADYLDICLQSNTTPNEDAEFNVIGGIIDKTEIDYTRHMLVEDYGVTLEGSEVIDLMEEYGLEQSFLPVGVSMHETIYDILTKQGEEQI
jgi:DNA-directed RNA polymerase subunit H (RpoH/RPB5)